MSKKDRDKNRDVGEGWTPVEQLVDKYGRPYVLLFRGGKREVRLIQDLVADAFLPPKKPTDTVVRHLNGDVTDNRVENLEWGTVPDKLIEDNA